MKKIVEKRTNNKMIWRRRNLNEKKILKKKTKKNEQKVDLEE